LKIEDQDTFINTLLEGQPEPPKYFAMMKRLNKLGPKILGSIPHPARLSVNKFKESVDKGCRIVDTRDKLSFAGGHIPGSLNIQDNNSFSTWAGWMLDYENPFILIAPEQRIDTLNRELIRIGMDNLAGYVSDLDRLEAAGLTLETLNLINPSELQENILDYKLIDVRSYTEYNVSHIPGSINIHTGFLEKNLNKINKEDNILLYCTSGDRSGIAASFLLKNGYKNVSNLSGGINNWINAGYKVKKGDRELTEVLD
jgi:hydroxyacylglutathione hydrolase